MTDTTLQELMHAVLDGEASAAQARTLERALASDPAARERFEELKRLFQALEQVPELAPPAHIVHTVTARAVLPRPFRGPGWGEQLRELLTGGTDMKKNRFPLAGVAAAAVAGIIGGYAVLEPPAGH